MPIIGSFGAGSKGGFGIQLQLEAEEHNLDVYLLYVLLDHLQYFLQLLLLEAAEVVVEIIDVLHHIPLVKAETLEDQAEDQLEALLL
jgi:hypothetical protein